MILVVVVDMQHDGLIVPVEERPPKVEETRPTYIPLDRWLEQIARAPYGVDIDRSTWGMDVSDEPPPAEYRSPPPEG